MNPPRPAERQPAWGTRRSRKNSMLLAVLVVVLLHGWLLLGWPGAVAPRVARVVAEAPAPATVWLRVLPTPTPVSPAVTRAEPRAASRTTRRTTLPTTLPPVPSTAPSRAARPAEPERKGVSPNAAPADPPAPATLGTIAADPTLPASAPLATPPHLLDSEATRRAIRQAGRQAVLSERAAQATGIPLRSQDTRYAAAAEAAGKSDCLKTPGAGGLLALPFLIARAVSGDCPK